MKENNSIQCVGFIMDGNRRYARKHNLSTNRGHIRGYEVLKEMIEVIGNIGIPNMVCYVFSTENWNRATEEVVFLLELFRKAFRDLQQENTKRTTKLNYKFIGERSKFAEDFCREMDRVEECAHPDPQLTVWIALSYGSRAEIVHAVNRAVAEGVSVTEDSFTQYLWTNGMPDPDIIIRTSGEQRLSNFLLWQSAYSELFFTDTLWPEFGEMEFKSILDQYEKRERRKGV